MWIRGAALAAAIGLAGCATNPVTGWPDFVLFSEEQELESGQRQHLRIIREYPLYEDRELAAYVGEVGDRLARHSHRGDLGYRFFVLDSAAVNAFALPGGYVYVTRGMLSHLDDEAQLAAVLGHEIGHIAARHGIRQQSRGVVVGVLGSAAAAVTGSATISDMSGVLGSVLLNGYGRRHELEADRLGAEYLARSGYPSSAMVEVLRILKGHEAFEARKQGGASGSGVYHGIFSTHPDNDRRLGKVVSAAGAGGATRNRMRYLERIRGMVYGPSRHQGVLKDGNFMHRMLDIHIAFPPGWSTENRADRLISVSPDGNEILQVTLTDRGGYDTPALYLAAQFPDFAAARSLVEGAIEVTIGTAALDTPFGSKAGRVAAAFHGDRIFVISAVGRQGPSTTLDAVAASLRPLTDAERDRIREQVIFLRQARAGESFEDLARAARIPDVDANLLRLLNNAYPGGKPAAGRTIKIPGFATTDPLPAAGGGNG